MNQLTSMLARLGRVFLFALTTAGALQAQGTTGAIEGRVFASSNSQNLQGAIVRVAGLELRAETDRNGIFQLRGVPAGSHEIEATYFGLPAARVPVTVAAGQTAFLSVNMSESGDDVLHLQKMRVEAQVLGQARAINQQRTADAMVNITSEEMFGETTDNNIAKALQRIPGISANSDGSTEIPRYINIRGFDATLNSVQLNGARLPTTNDGTSGISSPARGFALDDLPANSITNIEVVKAPTPDMDGDAVGGIVNLITKSAFDRSGRIIELKAGADYVTLREKFVPHFELGYANLLMDKRLGVRFDLSYYEGDEGFDNIDYDWLPLAPALPANQALGLTDSSVFAHEDTEYNNYFIERTRYGLSASLDYKLSDTTTLHFRPVYTTEERVEDDRRFHKIMDNDHARAAPATAVTGEVVWAITEARLHNYPLPRDSPRVTFYADAGTSAKDRARFFSGSTASNIVAIEGAWLAEVRAARLWLYSLPASLFVVADAGAGYYVARQAVRPLAVTEINDVPDALMARDVELRVLPSLWKLRDAVFASTLAYSFIRMRHAKPRIPGPSGGSDRAATPDVGNHVVAAGPLVHTRMRAG